MKRARRGVTPKWLRRALSVALGVSDAPPPARTRISRASWDRSHRTRMPEGPAYSRTTPVKHKGRIKP